MKKFVLFDFSRKYVILMTKRLKSWLNYVRAEFAEYKYWMKIFAIFAKKLITKKKLFS